MNSLKFAIRRLCKHPVSTAATLLTLALGVGATAAVYSVVHAVVLEPIPGSHADRLVVISQYDLKGRYEVGISEPDYQDLLEQRDLFEEIVAMDTVVTRHVEGDFAYDARGFRVTPNFFRVLEVQPAIGTLFPVDSEAPQLVLNYRWWQEHFRGDPRVIGQSVTLIGMKETPTIVGVAPPEFQFPDQDEFCHFWVSDRMQEKYAGPAPARSLRNWRTVVRLQPGVASGKVEAALAGISQRLAKEFPKTNENIVLRMESLRASFSTGEIRHIYLGLLGVVAIVLLIGVANIANLTLAGAESRRSEMALRLALGATRGGLVRQVLLECLVLGVVAAVFSLVIAHWSIGLLKTFLTATIPTLRVIELNWTVAGLALLLSLGAGIGFGLLPAWRAASCSPGENMSTTRSGATTPAGAWLSRSFVVAEIAMALVLLVAAGLMLTSVSRVLSIDPGYEYRNLVSVGLGIGSSGTRFKELHATQMEAMERFKALPGVEAAGFVSAMSGTRYQVEGVEEPEDLLSRRCSTGAFDYFRTLGAPLRAGRFFETGDEAPGSRTILVNEALASRFWPGGDPVGKRLRYWDEEGSEPWSVVVGVVGDIREGGFENQAYPTIYEPASRNVASYAFIMLRTATPLEMLAPSLKAELAAIATGFSNPRIRVVEDELRESSRSRRACMQLFVLFAGIGLLLAVIGIYGVSSTMASRRVREIGIRMALGAGRGSVQWLVLSQGALLILTGLVLGVGAALGLTRLLGSLLFEVSATDPRIFGLLSSLLAVVALAGCWLPARRAANIHPMDALRQD